MLLLIETSGRRPKKIPRKSFIANDAWCPKFACKHAPIIKKDNVTICEKCRDLYPMSRHISFHHHFILVKEGMQTIVATKKFITSLGDKLHCPFCTGWIMVVYDEINTCVDCKREYKMEWRDDDGK